MPPKLGRTGAPADNLTSRTFSAVTHGRTFCWPEVGGAWAEDSPLALCNPKDVAVGFKLEAVNHQAVWSPTEVRPDESESPVDVGDARVITEHPGVIPHFSGKDA